MLPTHLQALSTQIRRGEKNGKKEETFNDIVDGFVVLYVIGIMIPLLLYTHYRRHPPTTHSHAHTDDGILITKFHSAANNKKPK